MYNLFLVFYVFDLGYVYLYVFVYVIWIFAIVYYLVVDIRDEWIKCYDGFVLYLFFVFIVC